MTLDELRREQRAVLPAAVVVPLFGGRTWGFEAIRKGTFPVKPIRLGRRVVFATAEVQRVLGVEASSGR